jgi:hypothetical protein
MATAQATKVWLFEGSKKNGQPTGDFNINIQLQYM